MSNQTQPTRPQRRNRGSAARTRQENTIFYGLIGAFGVLALIAAAFGFNFFRQTFANQSAGALIPSITSGGEQSDTGIEIEPVDASGGVEAELERWDGSSRVNILILGLDYLDWRAGEGPPRSDTMILVSIDPVNKTAAMLSIPRDLWTNIPGFGSGKINTAYQIGEGNRLPGGGPGLAVDTVEDFLGVPINYYAQISFDTFVQFIDLIGGVKIDNPAEIKVALVGKPGKFTIPLGVSTLDGEQALAYVRARNSEGGDFDRAQRQQAAIIGIRNQLLRSDIQALILQNRVQLWNTFSEGIRTNITFTEAFKLGLLALEIDLDKIDTFVLTPPNYVVPGTSPDGLAILLPITQNIRLLRDQMFNSTGAVQPVGATTPIEQLVADEAARVTVLNSSQTSGLAGTTQTYLQGFNINVVETGNGSEIIPASKIYDYTGNPYTVKYLVELLGIQANRIFSRYDPNSTVDIVVELGSDWVVP
jgi:LCP family protein required for cell wall assembly